jgi:hypothetical protein
MGDNGSIRFTVKELLGEVNGKLDRISEKLDAKAEAHDVAALEARVSRLEGEAATESSLVAYRTQVDDQRKSDRRWTLGFAVATLLSVLSLSAAVFFNLI